MINMKVLQANEITKLSKAVDVKQDIPMIQALLPDIIELCKNPIGKFSGAYAIAHCQVEKENPLTFFVIKTGEVIINPVILTKSGRFPHSEGCLSYKYRPMKKVSRYSNIMVNYISLKKNKLSLWRLKTHKKREIKFVKGSKDPKDMLACIFQHEIHHFTNNYIY